MAGYLAAGSWNGLGVALHNLLPVIQIAEYTGVPGVTFVVAFAKCRSRSQPCAVFSSRRGCESGDRTLDFTLTIAAIVGLAGDWNSCPAND